MPYAKPTLTTTADLIQNSINQESNSALIELSLNRLQGLPLPALRIVL